MDRIVEYLCEPLARALRDDDPYVRKTAAVCVAKLYDISPEMVEDRGFLDILRDLICDSNPTVVANAVAALSEIQESSGRDVTLVTGSVLQKLLAALNECTEWGQVFILDALAKYRPQDQVEAEAIVERVTPRLQHANSAVVMSAVKVILGYMDLCNAEVVRTLTRKLAPPLVTLLNSEPEIQYVALRNINLIVQKRPQVLEHEIKVFFCKYNDPIYVKMEKLEVMIKLCSERNVEQVLLELKEYAQEVDVDFVRKAVRAIGRAAIKLERAAERCINVLLELIQTKVNYVVQEAIIVIKDIFRRYPNRYEQVIATLCENLETLDEPEAKAAMIWIIGQYADRIENADELLESFFLDTFEDETPQVQLQLLTATVKVFLKQPAETQALVQRVLNLATEATDNPDLRDRGFIYWRLLSHNPQVARAVVLGEKPTIADDTHALEPALLEQLMAQIATLSSVYHKPPEAFVVRSAVPLGQASAGDEYDEELEYLEEEIGQLGVAPGAGGGGQARRVHAAAERGPTDPRGAGGGPGRRGASVRDGVREPGPAARAGAGHQVQRQRLRAHALQPADRLPCGAARTRRRRQLLAAPGLRAADGDAAGPAAGAGPRPADGHKKHDLGRRLLLRHPRGARGAAGALGADRPRRLHPRLEGHRRQPGGDARRGGPAGARAAGRAHRQARAAPLRLRGAAAGPQRAARYGEPLLLVRHAAHRGAARALPPRADGAGRGAPGQGRRQEPGAAPVRGGGGRHRRHAAQVEGRGSSNV